MSYTAPFLPYTIYPDPVWLLTNTDKALGAHARTPMSETLLTSLLERFMAEEVSARRAAAKTARPAKKTVLVPSFLASPRTKSRGP